jgi:RimJ/RimL family protein N-acetyltransferase
MHNNALEIQTCYHLTKQQKTAVRNLLSTGSSYDGDFYDAELESPEFQPPFPIFYLIYDKTILIGFLSYSLFPIKENCFDIFGYAFIHPNRRKEGLFAQLLRNSTIYLKKASNRLNCIYFPTKNTTAHSSDHFFYDYSEYIMKKQLVFSNSTYANLDLEYEENEYGKEYSLWLEDTYIGGCLIASIGPVEAMIYEFGIIDSMQGQGYGKIGLKLICDALHQKQFETVSLQVSSKNKIAHSLYLNCGFQVTEELQYFRFVI